jgi:hypothetical protein
LNHQSTSGLIRILRSAWMTSVPLCAFLDHHLALFHWPPIKCLVLSFSLPCSLCCLLLLAFNPTIVSTHCHMSNFLPVSKLDIVTHQSPFNLLSNDRHERRAFICMILPHKKPLRPSRLWSSSWTAHRVTWQVELMCSYVNRQQILLLATETIRQ